MNGKLFTKVFLLILALAIFVRFFKLGEIPVSLYWDETAILVDATSIAETGHDIHNRPWYQLIYPSYGDYKLPVYIWLAGLSVKFFGPSEWAVRLPSALAGVATVILAGLIAGELFKHSREKKPQVIGLATMAIVAFSPWSIMFSRTAFEGHLAQFFLGLSIYLAILIRNKRNNLALDSILLSLTAMIGILATYTYFSVRFVWPVLFVAVQLFFALKMWGAHKPFQVVRDFLVLTIMPLIVFLLLLLPMMKSELYSASNQIRYSTDSVLNNYDYPVLANQYREEAGNTTIDRLIFHRYWLLIRELAKNYSDHLDLRFLFLTGDSNLRHGTDRHGLFLISMLPIFIYGLYALFLANKRTLAILIIWWLIALLPASVPEGTPHALRSLNALIPLSIIIGIGLYKLIIYLWENKHILAARLVGGIFSLLILFNFAHFYNHYFNHYPIESAPSWQYGYNQIAQLIGEYKDATDEIWVGVADDRLFLWVFAYSGFSPQEILNIPHDGYSFEIINNIYFLDYDWLRLGDTSYKRIIIDEVEDMQKNLTKITREPTWTRTIKTIDGKDKYSVVYFEK